MNNSSVTCGLSRWSPYTRGITAVTALPVICWLVKTDFVAFAKFHTCPSSHSFPYSVLLAVTPDDFLKAEVACHKKLSNKCLGFF